MAKRRSKKKAAKKRKKPASAPIMEVLPWKLMLVIVISAGVIAGAVLGGRHFFLNSGFFKVKDIAINKDLGYSLAAAERKLKRLYKGQNIFNVNLKEVRNLIRSDYPQLKKVEVRRALPDTLEVDVISREPVAVIEKGGVVIDKEGVVLAVREKPEDLMKIRGIGFFLTTPSRGEKVDNETLSEALLLISALRKKMRYRVKEVDYIDISKKNNILLGIYGVTVKMGIDDFSRKINKLNEILNDPNISMEDINYIDLRFEEAVISPK